MSWVMARPWLVAIEVAWRWIFGIPFLVVCWMQIEWMLPKLELSPSPFAGIDAQNPWVAAVQLSDVCTRYQVLVIVLAIRLLPLAALVWSIISGLGRSLLLKRMEPSLPVRPFQMMVLQAAWLVVLGFTCWGWFSCVGWVAATHIPSAGEPDL